MNRPTLRPLLPFLVHCLLWTPTIQAAGERIDQGIDWDYCAHPDRKQQLPPPPLPAAAPDATRIEADALQLDQQRNTTLFQGNVKVRRNEAYLEAQQALHQREQNLLELEGDILLQRPGLRASGEQGQFDLNSDQGWLEQVEYRFPERNARGNASRAEFNGDNHSRYEDVSYTSCRPGQSDWQLEAESLELDREEGVGVARHATLKLAGVPVLYAPYYSFPIDDRRKSGFLAPSLGSSSRGGTELTTPYYLNLAPDYDATLYPRLMSKRGLMLGGELRFLGADYKGLVEAEYLNDQEDNRPGHRGAFNLEFNNQFAPGWSSEIRANAVSDIDYLTDFGSGLTITSSRHIERRGELRYQDRNWSLLARLQNFQTVDRSIAATDRPYARLPQLRANYANALFDNASLLNVQAEYVYFDHSEKVRGHRLSLSPSISLPLRRSWGHLTPRFALNHASYQLDQNSGSNDSPSYTSSSFSLDGGLIFERDSDWFGLPAQQTLEPRIHYLYTPFEDQSEIPNFDSAELDLSFANLFRDNRFSGSDRVGDANQLSLGLSSQLLEQRSGRQRLRASIGQIFYFHDREVQLPDVTSETNSESAIVGELSAQLSNQWSSSATLRWDSNLEDGRFDRARAAIHYKDREQHLFNLGYNYQRDTIEDVDFSLYWPFSYRLTTIAALKQSLLHRRSMNQVIGLDYGGRCCWRLRAVFQSYVTDADEKADKRIMLQLVLNGLGAFGRSAEQTLKDSIFGYQPE
ncbi:LPS-assembly protein LptD [Candidatus Endoriftia persephonae]|uniref:LPS-assembly protein LptD n=1 Tax=Candidatus Endoriftia persephonae TaxID=393765 RepID=A0A9J6ZXL0_9GAMM|nr:LPS-assembly protein LptD [Candidatus Endoriftia persephone]USF87461.1 LPS-assembly protein LptD [Candidatus Endoriftia persephone]